MRLWLERAPLFELLPNPAHGRHTKAQEFRNFTGALIPFVKVDDSLARQQWYRSHDKTDSATRTPPKASYIIYGSALVEVVQVFEPMLNDGMGEGRVDCVVSRRCGSPGA